MKTQGGTLATGIQSFAYDAQTSIGVRGEVFGNTEFRAGIYGKAATTANSFA